MSLLRSWRDDLRAKPDFYTIIGLIALGNCVRFIFGGS